MKSANLQTEKYIVAKKKVMVLTLRVEVWLLNWRRFGGRGDEKLAKHEEKPTYTTRTH